MNICIFDTETVGKVSQDLLNVGYKIIDLNIQQGTYKVLQERDYLVGKLFNNTIYMLNDDFVGAVKYAKYTLALQKATKFFKIENLFFLLQSRLFFPLQCLSLYCW